MNIIFAIDEAYPLYKIGGLGDIGGSLPPQLLDLGIDLSLVVPLHPEINLDDSWSKHHSFRLDYHHQTLEVTVWLGFLPGTQVPTYLIEEPRYLSQHTDASDNHADKFAVFSAAVSRWLWELQSYFKPDLIHFHDWHTALIPVILKHRYDLNYKSIGTIHNLAYQGITDTPILDHLGLPAEKCPILAWDNQDFRLNILLEGLLHAHTISTVSPNYAKEILTPEYGQSVYPLLASRSSRLVGILNGIDTNLFNPELDPHLFSNFNLANWRQGKTENKLQLLQALKLSCDNNPLLIGFVGRVDAGQKGVQLIIQAIKDNVFSASNLRFVFLGTGNPQLENQLHQVATDNPQIHIATRYDEPLAAQIYAASDLMLIPSQFEPCGLVQMIAMRYGALPIARSTGGLVDSIDHDTNGFLFDTYSAQAMIDSLHHALSVIADPQNHDRLVTSAMNKDFSWNSSAQLYLKLYRQVLDDQVNPSDFA